MFIISVTNECMIEILKKSSYVSLLLLQILFGFLYIINLAIILYIYVKTDVVRKFKDGLLLFLFFFST